ncbi:MAG: hypothetical protein JKY41_03295 [Rhodobacteraceae bacterium]|nr:hypothetical protein [Paracoccaceae bacterium]
MLTKTEEVGPMFSQPPNLKQFSYWCPELILAHRYYYYKIEILLGKRYRFFSEIEKEIVHLKDEMGYCKWCKWQRLVPSAERSKFEDALEDINNKLEAIGEGYEPFRAERGLAEELYFSEEYDESGEDISGAFYGHGSHLAESTRIIFPLLELQDFIENILDDKESDITRIAEKRRYVQGVLECLGSIDHGKQYLEKTVESWELVERHLNTYSEAFMSLGFMLAEYKVRFRYEDVAEQGRVVIAARKKGQPNAARAHARQSKKRRKAVIKAAKEIYESEHYLKFNRAETARMIENQRLPALQKADKTYIGDAAIYKHLTFGFKNGDIK